MQCSSFATKYTAQVLRRTRTDVKQFLASKLITRSPAFLTTCSRLVSFRIKAETKWANCGRVFFHAQCSARTKRFLFRRRSTVPQQWQHVHRSITLPQCTRELKIKTRTSSTQNYSNALPACSLVILDTNSITIMYVIIQRIYIIIRKRRGEYKHLCNIPHIV